MIKKLKRRYMITNMILLSCTLLVALGILFAVLYRSQVESSYVMMNELLNESNLPPSERGEKRPEPTAYSDGDAVAAPMNEWYNWNGGGQQPGGESSSEKQESSGSGADFNPWSGQGGWNNQFVMPPPYWMIGTPPPWMIQQPDWNWEDSKKDESSSGASSDVPKQFGDWQNWQNQWPPGGWQQPGSQTQAPESGSKTTQTTPETGLSEPPHSGSDHRRDPQHSGEPPRDSSHTEGTQTVPDVTSETTVSASAVTAATTAAAQTTAKTTSTKASAAGIVTTTTSAGTTEPAVRVDEGHYVPDAYVARVDEDGNIESYAGNRSESDKDRKPGQEFDKVHHAMDKIRRNGSDSGTIEIGETPYRYLFQKDQSGSYHLVLLNRTLEISELTKLLVIFVLLAVVGLALMFGLSVLLANWTVTPIATAWEKQKQFVADASHELKTPLAVISANTEVILANPAEQVSGQSKWLNYIQSETMRMSKLITNLLTVARMDDGSVRMQTVAPLKLSETVSSICLLFEPIVFEQGKNLSTVIQRNVTLRAEEDNVRQLLSILLDNAVVHSVPRAQITVSLSKDTQGRIRLAVSNTAKDIPPEQLSHLFDRFYRVDTEGSPNGSGLGLSIAQSIVRQMGGTLTVTSENSLVTFVATFTA